MKLLYVRSVALLLLFAFVRDVNAADTTITIKGNVIASPCTVEAVKEVDFGTIYISSLGSGAYTDVKTVSIALTNCPTGTTEVTATFSGTPEAGNNYPAWNYTNEGTAVGYFINVAQSADSSMGLGNGKTWTKTINTSTRTASFDIAVRIGRNSMIPVPTPGTIAGVISVTFSYS